MPNSVTTFVAREKFANAHFDDTLVPKIAQIGWGDGGTDIDGTIVQPEPDQITVEGEFLRKNIAERQYPYNNDSMKVMFLGVLDVNDDNVKGEVLSSCGLYDDAGDLIAVKNFSDKGLDEDTKVEIEWIEEF